MPYKIEIHRTLPSRAPTSMAANAMANEYLSGLEGDLKSKTVTTSHSYQNGGRSSSVTTTVESNYQDGSKLVLKVLPDLEEEEREGNENKEEREVVTKKKKKKTTMEPIKPHKTEAIEPENVREEETVERRTIKENSSSSESDPKKALNGFRNSFKGNNKNRDSQGSNVSQKLKAESKKYDGLKALAVTNRTTQTKSECKRASFGGKNTQTSETASSSKNLRALAVIPVPQSQRESHSTTYSTDTNSNFKVFKPSFKSAIKSSTAATKPLSPASKPLLPASKPQLTTFNSKLELATVGTSVFLLMIISPPNDSSTLREDPISVHHTRQGAERALERMIEGGYYWRERAEIKRGREGAYAVLKKDKEDEDSENEETVVVRIKEMDVFR